MSIKSLYPNIRPSLLLDFAKTKAIDSRITFTRGSTGTYVGANGLIATAASGAARFDHDPLTGECNGLLIDESRTNLATNSSSYVSWNTDTAGVVTIDNAAVAPDGSNTAFSVTQDTSTGYHKLGRFGLLSTNNANHYFSAFVKYNGHRYVAFLCNITAGVYGAYDLISGTAAVGSITKLENGWFRIVSSPYNSNSVSANTLIFSLQDLYSADYNTNGGSQGRSYTGDGVSGIYVWGFQAELGSAVSSYIPTTSAAVTRAADVLSMTGTNFSSWYNNTQGTLVFNSKIQDSTNATASIVFGGYLWATNPNGWRTSGNGSLLTTNVSRTTTSKHAFGLQSNNHAVSINGATVGTATANNSQSPSGTAFSINSANPVLCGTISRIAYYPVRVTNAQLQALSAL